jgi:hypothetical protein
MHMVRIFMHVHARCFASHLCVSVNEQDEAVIVHCEVTSSNKFTVTLLPHLQQHRGTKQLLVGLLAVQHNVGITMHNIADRLLLSSRQPSCFSTLTA